VIVKSQQFVDLRLTIFRTSISPPQIWDPSHLFGAIY